jgi:SAM-dependent methyltransferase
MEAAAIDPTKLESFVMRALGDLAGTYGGMMVNVGHKLGLYKAMAGAGPISGKQLAARVGCAERYVQEWLNAQAAGGYVDYHAASDSYELSAEHALVLADENSPVFIPNAWNAPAALWDGQDRTLEAFRTGKGVPWAEHDARLHCGSAAFYRNGYRANLVAQWLPALDGVVAQLEAGIRVADVGCGHGHSTVLMAQAFPRSRFFGFDVHAASIDEARRIAAEAGVADRVTFDVARAADYRGESYGLVCFFDCLHDLGDPVAAVSHTARVLAPGGTVMLVEPFANDRVEDNLSTVSRLFYAASAMVCCAHAISEGGKLVLGAQAGQSRLAEVFRAAGLEHFRRAAETPFNLIFEARR